MKMTSFGSLKRLFACLSVPREVVSYLLSGSLDLSFQICALGHALYFTNAVLEYIEQTPVLPGLSVPSTLCDRHLLRILHR